MSIYPLIIKRTIKFFSLLLLRRNTASWQDFVTILKTDISRIKMYKSVLHFYPDNSKNHSQYYDELLFLKQHKTFLTFPYEKIRTIIQPTTGIDDCSHLPYVIHKNKKLFFPETWTEKQALDYYIHAVSVENILEIGEGYLTKTPHKYQSSNHKIENGDILIDAGCAEGLFSLNAIDQVSHVTIIECDKQWERPLEETFKPYKNKVEFIFKMLGDKDCDNTISLPTILQNLKNDTTFIKMDIEGAEVNVLKSSIDFFSKCTRTVKVSCCTYHNNDDFDKVHSLLSPLASSIENSDGHMLIFDYKDNRPYFRHGVIRATLPIISL